MNWGIITTVLTGIFVPIIVALWAAFIKLRDNELHDLKNRLERIEAKLDRHIEAHNKMRWAELK